MRDNVVLREGQQADMANFITLLRLTLVFVIIALMLYGAPLVQLISIPLLMLTIILDGIDGMVARVRNEVSLFGAIFDIAADRIIEMSLWILLIKLGSVSIWIGLIFVVRGILVDSLRNQQSTRGGVSPFGIMKTGWGRFLVASRSMRFSYGFIKLFTFSWLLFLVPCPNLYPRVWALMQNDLVLMGHVLIYLTLALCLLRGIPVVLEAILIKP